MESLDYWRLCEELSIIQAALLITGHDPSVDHAYVEDWTLENRPTGYEAVKTALIHAVHSKRLNAIVRHDARLRGYMEEADSEHQTTSYEGIAYIFKVEPDWSSTIIKVDDLIKWLAGRGFRDGFFFPAVEKYPDYLNQQSNFYTPKLAAAIEAWKAVSENPDAKAGRSIKQALTKWLRINASRFGLYKDDGTPNEQGIEEIAKIANWETKGGAPKTPTT
jgi:hypothetical protein